MKKELKEAVQRLRTKKNYCVHMFSGREKVKYFIAHNQRQIKEYLKIFPHEDFEKIICLDGLKGMVNDQPFFDLIIWQDTHQTML